MQILNNENTVFQPVKLIPVTQTQSKNYVIFYTAKTISYLLIII